jgi:hypothetical protein
MEFLSSVPAQAWLILAVAIGFTIVLIGLSIKKKIDDSKKVDVHVGKDGLDVHMTRAVAPPVHPMPAEGVPPSNAEEVLNKAADHLMNLGKAKDEKTPE